jgi:hypothetical protein
MREKSGFTTQTGQAKRADKMTITAESYTKDRTMIRTMYLSEECARVQ